MGMGWQGKVWDEVYVQIVHVQSHVNKERGSATFKSLSRDAK